MQNSSLMRQLLSQALLPRQAWGSADDLLGSRLHGQPGAEAPSWASGVELGGPAMMALGLVDDSFRRELSMLREAAAKHRQMLEKVRLPDLDNVGPMPTGAAMPAASISKPSSPSETGLPWPSTAQAFAPSLDVGAG
jgi:hypothetical protein